MVIDCCTNVFTACQNSSWKNSYDILKVTIYDLNIRYLLFIFLFIARSPSSALLLKSWKVLCNRNLTRFLFHSTNVQHGFRPNLSTVSTLLPLHCHLRTLTKAINLTKAFDMVNHTKTHPTVTLSSLCNNTKRWLSVMVNHTKHITHSSSHLYVITLNVAISLIKWPCSEQPIQFTLSSSSSFHARI